MSEEVDDLTEEDEHLSVCSTSSMIRPLRAQEANQVSTSYIFIFKKSFETKMLVCTLYIILMKNQIIKKC